MTVIDDNTTAKPRQRVKATHEVVTLDQANPPRVAAPATTKVELVARLASDPSADIDKIKVLLDLLNQEDDRKAEREFNDAMSAAQAEMTSIAKDSFNPQTRSKYASYDATNRAIRPIYTRHGLSVSFDESDCSDEGYIKVMSFVAKGGYTRTYHYNSPIITTGMGGKTMMTLTHARASAVTYAKRYLVGMIFNLSTGEDTDGNVPQTDTSSEGITEQQLDELNDLIDRGNSDAVLICSAMTPPITMLGEMSQAQFRKVKGKLLAKIASMGQPQ